MDTASLLLIMSAAGIACVHTAIGPDHYIPFIAMGKARQWSLAKTLRITFYCGLGHVLSSIVIGAIGIWLGAELASLVAIEGSRGNLAGWALLAFGCMYFAWGLRKAGQSRSHSHVHSHGDVVHEHHHDHSADHAHVHTQGARGAITPWALFIVFVLGPCEALIPLFMYPAATQNPALVIAVALVFGVVTLATMLAIVAGVAAGIHRVSLPAKLGAYSHAFAGASVALCGAGITAMSLLA
ncbi:MAG: sulfite exporter TauE/SafE family protein [Pseudomonadota bacterium]